MSKSPIYCEHANESPSRCPCPDDCYCKEYSCKIKRKEKMSIPSHSQGDKMIRKSVKSQASTIASTISEIKEILSRLEESAAWTVKASQRFVIGDRVEFIPSADSHGIGQRTKRGVRTGKIVAISSDFIISVLLDGYKKPSGYHHSFFVSTTKKKTKK